MQTFELGQTVEIPVVTLDEAVRIHQESSHRAVEVFQGRDAQGNQVVMTDDAEFADFFQTVIWVN